MGVSADIPDSLRREIVHFLLSKCKEEGRPAYASIFNVPEYVVRDSIDHLIGEDVELTGLEQLMEELEITLPQVQSIVMIFVKIQECSAE